MKRYFEPIIQVLFLVLSVVGSIVHSDAYVNIEVYRQLFLTNIINAAIVGIYLIARAMLWNKNALEPLQRAMLLFVVYSCLPVFFLMTLALTRTVSAICFMGALSLFIAKNLHNEKYEGSVAQMKKGTRIALSMPLFVFGVGFLARGISVILSYTKGAADVTDMFVSISDILISIIWIIVAIGIIKKSAYGASNTLACYIHASLLFIGLIVFLLLNPLIFGLRMDLESIVVISIMGLIFFIPTVLLIKNSKIGSENL